MNNLCYSGRLTSDITVKDNDGKKSGRFNLAHNEGWGENETTDFPTVYVNGQVLERMQKAGVKKGSAIEIVGRVRFISKKEGDVYKNNHFIIADNWEYAMSNAKKKEGEDAPASKPSATTAPANTSETSEAAPSFGDFAADETDMPF